MSMVVTMFILLSFLKKKLALELREIFSVEIEDSLYV